MSEYQYYEFQAVDRLLDAQARQQLRAISSRARITASSFVNSYDFGDLKADPLKLLERYFDLFVYVANWGTRWFAMKLPKKALDHAAVQFGDLEEDLVALRPAGEHVIVSISRNEVESEDWDDGSSWLASLAPLRGELLAGVYRLFPLLWLIQVENAWVADDAVEPQPGIGPLSPALAALAEFLCVDGDLLEAAAGSASAPAPIEPAGDVESFLRALPEDEKVALLLRLHSGEPHLGAELRWRAAAAAGPAVQPHAARRTAGELRAAARLRGAERKRLAEEKAAAQARRREEEAVQARAKHLAALAGHEEGAWREVERLIEMRNPLNYERATTVIVDLGEIAACNGTRDSFARRLADVRARHARKGQFIARLGAVGLPGK